MAAIVGFGCSGHGAGAGKAGANSRVHDVSEERARSTARQAFAAEIADHFPDAEYITGIGESDRSASIAEMRAVSNAAAAIRSSIERSFRVAETGAFRNGEGSIDTETVDTIVFQVQTDLAGVIRAVPSLTRNTDHGWLAVAAVRREDLDVVQVERVRGLIERLVAMYQDAIDAATELEVVALACRMGALEAELDLRSQERWAVSRRSFWTQELQSRRDAARRRYAEARAAQRVVVRGTGSLGGIDPGTAIVRKLTSASARFLVLRGAVCPSGAVVLAPTLRRACDSTSLGATTCTLTLRVAGRVCGQSGLRFSVIREATASDSRGEERAAKAAARKMDVEGVAEDAAREARDLVEGRCSSKAGERTG